jgi:prevent-host-death family protein
VRTVAVFEAKNRLSELLTAVEQGEEITITRHGCPVARIVSANAPTRADQDQRERVSGALARLRSLRRGSSLGASLPEAIEDGRD